jgi:hypothetical protein
LTHTGGSDGIAYRVQNKSALPISESDPISYDLIKTAFKLSCNIHRQ